MIHRRKASRRVAPRRRSTTPPQVCYLCVGPDELFIKVKPVLLVEQGDQFEPADLSESEIGHQPRLLLDLADWDSGDAGDQQGETVTRIGPE